MIEFKRTTDNDLLKILELYNYYIKNSTATFHLENLTLDKMKDALPLNHSKYKTFTIYFNKEFCGYCYFGNYKPRQAYNRTAELSLYLRPEFQQKGIGTETLMFLEKEAIQAKIKNLIGVITYENSSSVKLFTKMGYEMVGHLKNIGEKFGRILDVVIFQKEI